MMTMSTKCYRSLVGKLYNVYGPYTTNGCEYFTYVILTLLVALAYSSPKGGHPVDLLKVSSARVKKRAASSEMQTE
jgi:hypothetical protein